MAKEYAGRTGAGPHAGGLTASDQSRAGIRAVFPGRGESAPGESREQSPNEPLAQAAHELRNTVGSILTSLEATLDDGDLAPRDRRRLMIAQRNSGRLARLAEDLLLVEVGEARGLALDLAPVDMATLIEECVESAEGAAEKLGIELFAVPASDLVVTADADRLAQVVDNLVANALKFTTPPGRVVVDAEARDLEIVVRVTDDGTGIDEQDAQGLFEPFYRRPVGGRSFAGSGLGLAVCRAIIEAHGGRIWAERGPELGATFNFTLPMARAAT